MVFDSFLHDVHVSLTITLILLVWRQ